MQELWMGGGGGPLDPPLVYWLGWIDTVGKLALPIPPQSLRPRCAPASRVVLGWGVIFIFSSRGLLL